jgi:hypothetical protein
MKLDKLVTHVVTLDELASLLGSVTKGQQPDYIQGRGAAVNDASAA